MSILPAELDLRKVADGLARAMLDAALPLIEDCGGEVLPSVAVAFTFRDGRRPLRIRLSIEDDQDEDED